MKRWADIKAARFSPEQLAAMEKSIARQCGNELLRPGFTWYYCTLDKGHDGEHVYGIEDRPVTAGG